MEQYAGIDVSLDSASVCLVDAQGKILKEAKVACEPERVPRGRARQDPERGQGRLRARGADRLVRRTWDTDGADRPGGRAVVAVALCRDEGGRLSRGAARDAPCARGVQ